MNVLRAVTGAVLLLGLVTACAVSPSHDTPYYQAGVIKAWPADSSDLQQRILLLGDAGDSSLRPWQPSLAMAAARAAINPDKTQVLMLGDNIYDFGFPKLESSAQQDLLTRSYSKSQQELIDSLNAQLDIARQSKAAMSLLPGNHDWYASQIDQQAQYIAAYAAHYKVDVALRPWQRDGQSHVSVKHFSGVSIVFIDSQWLIKAQQAPFDAEIKKLRQLLDQTRAEYPQQLLLIAAHHPLETMGPHGGYHTSRMYRFGMQMIDLFAELDQDTDDPAYQRYRNAVQTALAARQRTVVAAGHDHSLQIFRNESGQALQYQLVSGAANESKLTGVGHNSHTLFALAQEGFLELEIYPDRVTIKAFDIHHQDAVYQGRLY